MVAEGEEWLGFPFAAPIEESVPVVRDASPQQSAKRRHSTESASAGKKRRQSGKKAAKSTSANKQSNGSGNGSSSSSSSSSNNRNGGENNHNSTPNNRSDRSSISDSPAAQSNLKALDVSPTSSWVWDASKVIRGRAGQDLPADITNAPCTVCAPDAEWVVVSLFPGERLVCVGSARVCCVQGRVDVLGLVLDGRDFACGDGRGASATIHAPAWHGAITIRAFADDRHGRAARGSVETVAARVLMVAAVRSLHSEGGDDGGSVGYGPGSELLLNAIVDGNDATRTQRKRLRNGGLGKGQDVSELSLPGWCVLAPVTPDAGSVGGSGSGPPSASPSVQSSQQHGYPVTLVPESWRVSADRLVRDHVRQLDRRMTLLKLLTVRRLRQQQQQQQQQQQEKEEEKERGGGEDSIGNGGTSQTGDGGANPDVGVSEEEPLVAMVCGAKGVGKSSCTRYVVHRLTSARRDWLRAQLLGTSVPGKAGDLTAASTVRADGTSVRRCSNRAWREARVMVLDLDVGQPEMTPPGLLSLHAVGGRLMGHSGDEEEEEEEEGDDDPHGVCPALLGPPHTHLEPPLRSFFVGDTTPKRSPMTYLQCVAQLIATFRSLPPPTKTTHDSSCRDHAASVAAVAAAAAAAADADAARECLSGSAVPLVVNCDGWVKGLGLEILGNIIQLVQPTHVLQLQGQGRSKQFDLPTAVAPDPGAGLLGISAAGPAPPLSYAGTQGGHLPSGVEVQSIGSWDSVDATDTRNGCEESEGASAPATNAASIAPAPVRATAANPADQRTVRVAAYFARAALAGAAATPGGTGVLGCSLPPLTAMVRSGALADSDCSLAALLAAAAPYRVSMDAVQLLSLDDAELPNHTERLHAFNGSLVGLVHVPLLPPPPPEGTGADYPPTPPLTPECFGLGIVRSIDCSTRCFYILTPVAPKLLRYCNALVRPPSGSGMTLPTQLLYTSSAQTYPYLFCESAGSAATTMKSRNNLQRGGGGAAGAGGGGSSS